MKKVTLDFSAEMAETVINCNRVDIRRQERKVVCIAAGRDFRRHREITNKEIEQDR